MPAMAQDAAAPAVQEEEDAIVVTGIRETIQNSINTKREETAIVDALSADDIGDLPALSVGQAIQTITGATTHRERATHRKSRCAALAPFCQTRPSTRSEERRVGKECVSTCSTRGSADH